MNEKETLIATAKRQIKEASGYVEACRKSVEQAEHTQSALWIDFEKIREMHATCTQILENVRRKEGQASGALRKIEDVENKARQWLDEYADGLYEKKEELEKVLASLDLQDLRELARIVTFLDNDKKTAFFRSIRDQVKKADQTKAELSELITGSSKKVNQATQEGLESLRGAQAQAQASAEEIMAVFQAERQAMIELVLEAQEQRQAMQGMAEAQAEQTLQLTVEVQKSRRALEDIARTIEETGSVSLKHVREVLRNQDLMANFEGVESINGVKDQLGRKVGG